MRLEQHHDRANDHKESHHVQQVLAWEIQEVGRQVPFNLPEITTLSWGWPAGSSCMTEPAALIPWGWPAGSSCMTEPAALIPSVAAG